MWKLIINNLWSRRKRNGWIMSELVLVTIILFHLADKVTVSLYDSSLPLGYDYDRLCIVSLKTYTADSRKYDIQRDNEEAKMEDVLAVLRKIKSLPEVENATPTLWHYMNSTGGQSKSFYSGNKEKDSLNIPQCITFDFFSGYNYFETYGIKTMEGSPTAEELSKMSFSPNDIVVTRTYANLFYPNENIIGKNVFYKSPNNLNDSYRVVGIVDAVRFQSYERTDCAVFMPKKGGYLAYSKNIIIRLKEVIDVEKFVLSIQNTIGKDLRSGNIFVKNIISYKSAIHSNEQEEGILSQRHLQLSLMIFFLINLCLGVIGTFWLQTRDRTEEVGVLRSFGAKRLDILSMLLGESVVIATISVAVGCLIYLQIALKMGLYEGYTSFFILNIMDTWITHFWAHFMIISMLSYSIITITVLIGTYLPARILSNINPIDALRDE